MRVFNGFTRGLIIAFIPVPLCASAKLFPWASAIATVIPAFPARNGLLAAEYRKNSSTVRLQASQPASQQVVEGETARRSLIKFAEELSLCWNETTYGFPQINFPVRCDVFDAACKISINFIK